MNSRILKMDIIKKNIYREAKQMIKWDLLTDQEWTVIRQKKKVRIEVPAGQIASFSRKLPEDWDSGYKNVTVVCVCESQQQANRQIPAFLEIPIWRREIKVDPLVEKMDFEPWLAGGKIKRVSCSGEVGSGGRLCRYEWVLDLREQCVRQKIEFCFARTGTNFQKGQKQYRIAEAIQKEQAAKAGIDYNPQKEEQGNLESLFERLSESKFRSGFRLGKKEIQYAEEKGRDTIRLHAQEFVRKRLAPAEIANDGRQTPMRGHPVFLAQHATGTCCRGCLYKWHRIEKGRELSEEEQAYIVSVICEWIARQMKSMGKDF